MASSSNQNFEHIQIENQIYFEDEEPLYAAGDPAFQPQFFQPDNIPAFNPLVHAAQANRITPRFPQRPSCNFYAKEAASEDENFESFGLTVNQIKFRRRYYFAQRERKHAVAIVHPETKEVLLPGKAKITEEEEENQRQNALEAERLNQIFYEKQRLLKEALDYQAFLEEQQKMLCPYHDFHSNMSH